MLSVLCNRAIKTKAPSKLSVCTYCSMFPLMWFNISMCHCQHILAQRTAIKPRVAQGCQLVSTIKSTSPCSLLKVHLCSADALQMLLLSQVTSACQFICHTPRESNGYVKQCACCGTLVLCAAAAGAPAVLTASTSCSASAATAAAVVESGAGAAGAIDHHQHDVDA